MSQDPVSPKWAFAAGGALFAAIYAALAAGAVGASGWPPTYPLDDTYIQMALARTLAESGTYGFIAGIPSFSSSSPLWVLLLAASWFVAPLTYVPAAMNVAAALLLIGAGARYLAGRGLSRAWVITGTLALVIVPPLPAIAGLGMEHVLHAWLSLIFAAAVVAIAGGAVGRRAGIVLPVIALFLVACRFEGLFLVAPGALLLARRRFLLAVATVSVALLPVVIHGTLSVRAGWFPLPAPLVVKGNVPAARTPGAIGAAVGARVNRLGEIAATGARQFDVSALVMVTGLNILGLAWALRRRERAGADVTMSALFLMTLVLHGMLAKLDRSYGRYEAYLLVLGMAAGIPWLAQAIARGRAAASRHAVRRAAFAAAAIAGLVLAAAVLSRSVTIARRIEAGSREVFLQQYQMGRFARQAYAGQSVVINDLGLVTFAGRINPIDFVGLGTIETARLRKAGLLTPEAIEGLARERGAALAIVYPEWLHYYAGGVPPSWTPIADLTIRAKTIVAHRRVRFYALAPRHAARLRAELESFAPSLPADSTLTWVDRDHRP